MAGWMGELRHVHHVLATIGADQDEAGQFYVRGQIVSFLGLSGPDAEMVIGPDAQYRIAGEWVGLAAALNATSYGLRNVEVI